MPKEHDNGIWPQVAAFFFGATFAVFSLFIFLNEIRGVEGIISEKSMSYNDFSTLLLTSVAVIVTVMGVMMAFLAFVGFQHIRDQARKSAAEMAREQIEASIRKGGALRKLVEERLEEIRVEKVIVSHAKGESDYKNWPEDIEKEDEEEAPQ